MEAREQHEQKGKNNISQNSSKALGNNKAKAKEKGYKGNAKFSLEELERYRKNNKCFKCGEQVHVSRVCPNRSESNEPPRVTIIEDLHEDGHCKGSPLSYACRKVRDHDALILFALGFTHSFISVKLVTRLGIHDFEMGNSMKADGAFKGQDVLVIPLIRRLRPYVQSDVDKEDFIISSLKHEDVILGTPWLDCMAAVMKFPERKVLFSYRGKELTLDVNSPPWDLEVAEHFLIHYTYGCDYTLQGVLTYGKIGEWRCDKRSYVLGAPPRNLSLPPPGVPESVQLQIYLIGKEHERVRTLGYYIVVEGQAEGPGCIY
ncbi:hypothetical protein L7F22_045593 [Adiantum nelumboides]|nr:hypothetical protein [Adiantum nelumboides]